MELGFQAYFSRQQPGISPRSAAAVIELAAEGGTVPFIARYRKERTGNLDEVQIRDVIEAHATFGEIIKRKIFITGEIRDQGNLSDELAKRIEASDDLGELEEIYRPFKKKKKTKATIAREAGLEPLADWIWALGHGELEDLTTLEVKAKDYIKPAAGFVTYEIALKGAQDIIVDRIFNDPGLREAVRRNFFEKGGVVSKKTKAFKAHSKFEMYADFGESVRSLQESKSTHRYMAMRRGWNEGELTVAIVGDEDELLLSFERFASTKPESQAAEFLKASAKTAFAVHVHPSISNEVHRVLKEKADRDAISVFAENVRRVLLSSPFGPRCVLGVDPGLRTGCKVALIDKQGNFISHTVLQILGNDAQEKAKQLFQDVLKQIKIESVAVGNGTGGREAETFLRKTLKELGAAIPVVMVSESGASVYSASDVAREEFPDLDITIRGAISIARRLQDPLAELVKVDPKSIGVGQYQHDVSPTQLKKSLEDVVESCVNGVGVDLNTASAPLLAHVAGIGPSLAKAILEHRKTAGLFQERNELLKVPRFSSKVYEQCAGFLRIASGRAPLDATGIHPERYPAVKDMAQELGTPVSQLMGEGAKKLLPLKSKWSAIVGEFTFDDIVRELERPGRDPRDPFKMFSFRDDIFEVKDLKDGMICPGIVTNVTNFGAFVDVGVHQDGLVHISELSHKFVDDPRKVVNPGDQTIVRVLAVDLEKKQISLSMLMEPKQALQRRAAEERAADRPPREARPGTQSRPRPPRVGDGRGPRGPAPGPESGPESGPGPGGAGSHPAQGPARNERTGARGPQANTERGARPRTDRNSNQRPDQRNDQRPQQRQDPRFDQRPGSGQGQGPGQSGGDRGGDRSGPRKPLSPFNNPFAALGNLDRGRK